MSKSNGLIYPPENILNTSLIEKNYELIILWMLNNNESCGWADFSGSSEDKLIPESTLSTYLNNLKGQGYIHQPKRNTYIITSEGKERLNELIYLKESGGTTLIYPPKLLLRKRNYNHWILWMLYNNDSCRWSDFTNNPLNINQSSLSKNIKALVDENFIKNENKEYFITPLGKTEYFKMLREYDLDRQSILEEESKRIQELTKFTNEFFDRYGIEDDGIKFRFLNNVLNLNYSKVENLLEEEEDFNKILLFLSINHPDQYPDYISREQFASEYNLKKTILDFFLDKIVDEEFYGIKFFKLEVPSNRIYYFQANEKIERLLRAIVDDYITRFTYLNNLYENTDKKAPALTISNILEKILGDICANLFHNELKDALRRFLPEYIKHIKYKIETEKKLVTDESRRESFIWQSVFDDVEAFSLSTTPSPVEGDEKTYTLYHYLFEALDIYYLSKLNIIDYCDIREHIRPKNINIFNEIINLLKSNENTKAVVLFDENKGNLNEIENLILQDIILTIQYKLEESIAITNKLIEMMPESYIGYLLQSLTFFLGDDLERSLDVIEQGITKTENVALIAQKAQILNKKDESKEALAFINMYLPNYPQNALLLRVKFTTFLCDCHYLFGHSIEDCLELIDSAIALKPQDLELMIIKAIFLCFIKKYNDADNIIRDQMDFKIDLFEAKPRIDTSTIFVLVYSYMARGKFMDALDIANKILNLYPSHPISNITKAFVLGFGLVYDLSGGELNRVQFSDLIETAKMYDSITSNKAIYLQFKGLILQQLGVNKKDMQLIEEAIEVIEEAIKLKPEDLDLNFSKIYYLLTSKRENEALEAIDSFIKDYPKHKSTLYKTKSYIYHHLEEYEAGLKIIDEIIDEYPKDYVLINNKALALAKLKRGEEAIEAAEKLIKLNPKEGNSYDSYGEILMELGRYEEAIDKFQKAIELDPTGWFVTYTYKKMGECYKNLGELDLAKQCEEKHKAILTKLLPTERCMSDE